MTKKAKAYFEQDISCQHCSKMNHVKVERVVITPAEPAEVELKVTVEKAGTQTKLEDEDESE